jgi:CheY-like chemotaxis protein
MFETGTRILIVDDEPTIRSSMSQLLDEIGYCVRCAEDGFSALLELGNELPDILLSDLNMPGMSGFELLSQVRHRFPSVRAIAMSGAFHGDEVPSGVAADAFFQKGSSMASLLRILDTLPRSERRLQAHPGTPPPLWMPLASDDSPAEAGTPVFEVECQRIEPHSQSSGPAQPQEGFVSAAAA